MASVLRSVGSSASWRNHQVLADFEDSPVPDRFRKRPSCTMNALRMSLRKRMPLKDVEVNFNENPTWESLKAKEKPQNLQALRKRAKTVFGTVSQKIQNGCQGPKGSRMTSLAKVSGSNLRDPNQLQSILPQTPQRKSSALADISTPTSGTKVVSPPGQRKAFPAGSQHSKKNSLFPLRRSTRAASLRSPYGSPGTFSQRRSFNRNLERISTGIRQLKRLSQAFNDIIVQEERDQAVINYYQVMAQNFRAAQRGSRGPSRPSLRRRAVQLQKALRTWMAECSQEH